MSPSGHDALETQLQEWLCVHLAAQLEVPGGRIDPTESISSYGLDSLKAVAVLTDVEEHVGFEIAPEALWDYPTVAAFARFLADRLAVQTP